MAIMIIFEGLDKSGKTTQSKLLKEAFDKLDIRCEVFSFPNRSTPIGNIIDKYLKSEIELEDHAVHLLFSANRWETIEEINKKLKFGINIIVDRYTLSGVAYSAAKGLDINWCKQCDIGLPCQNILIFLDKNIDYTSNTVETLHDIERYENLKFQNVVAKYFKDLLDDIVIKDSTNCVILHAQDDKIKLHKKILKFALSTLNNLDDN